MTSRLSPSSGTRPSMVKINPPTVLQRPEGKLRLQRFGQLAERDAAAHAVPALLQLLHQRVLHIELVGDLPHHLLEQVLQRDESGGPTELVDEDHQMRAATLHLGQQLGGPLGVGNEADLAHHLADGPVVTLVAHRQR